MKLQKSFQQLSKLHIPVSKNRELKFRIINHLIESNLIKLNDKIVIAVSGGMDSMFLLYLMIEVQKVLNINIAIGHVNHNIRPNSIKDENFVIEQGKKLNIPVIVKKLNYNVRKINESTEEWARENRYAQLESIRKELAYDLIATGHHRNDQIETILQRMSEKSGIGGLKGIHLQRGNIIRPILNISKIDIENIVRDFQIKYVTDETNKNLEIPRNYIRHQIIPQWELLFPKLGESIQSICDSAKENQVIVDYFIESLVDKIVTEDNIKPSKKINLKGFNNLPDTVKTLLFKHLIGNKPWRQFHWNEINKIIKSAKVGKVYNFEGYELLKDRKDWIIRYKLKVNLQPKVIQLNNSNQYGDNVIMVREVNTAALTEDKNHEIICGDEIINSELVIRKWQEGDTFQSLGMKGNKKISDFLTDEKVNQFEKESQLVLTANNEIVWLCGRRISEKVKITDDTKRFLELSIKTMVG